MRSSRPTAPTALTTSAEALTVLVDSALAPSVPASRHITRSMCGSFPVHICGQPDLKPDPGPPQGPAIIAVSMRVQLFVPVALPDRRVRAGGATKVPIMQRCVGIDIGNLMLKATLRGRPRRKTRREAFAPSRPPQPMH